MTLLTLQREMRAWLTGSDATAQSFESTARAGLDVYQNNYRAQLVACLTEKFERVHAWLGDDVFLGAAARHIDAIPPHEWTLDRYGGDFPRTLRALFANDPEVAELAWLDCALTEAFVGPDAQPLSQQALATIDWDRAVFRFTPTLRVGQVYTNSTALWSALSAGKTPPQIETLPQPAIVLVWRKQLTSCFRTLDASEANAVERMRKGASFGELCNVLVESEGTEGIRIAGEMLARWLRDEFLIEVEYPALIAPAARCSRSP